MSEKPFLTTRDVAQRLGVGPDRVRELDDQLAPMRTASGQRLFRADAVDRVVRERAARRGGGK